MPDNDALVREALYQTFKDAELPIGAARWQRKALERCDVETVDERILLGIARMSGTLSRDELLLLYVANSAIFRVDPVCAVLQVAAYSKDEQRCEQDLLQCAIDELMATGFGLTFLWCTLFCHMLDYNVVLESVLPLALRIDDTKIAASECNVDNVDVEMLNKVLKNAKVVRNKELMQKFVQK